MTRIIKPIKRINGKVNLPGDEFTSHLALVLAAISQGQSTIRNISPSKNCQMTTRGLKQLGINIELDANQAVTSGRGAKGFIQPKEPIDFEDSKNTLYLLAGILCGLEGQSRLRGDLYLAEEFMNCLAGSLEKMGIEVEFSKGTKALIGLRNRRPAVLNFHFEEKNVLARTSLQIASLSTNGYSNFIGSGFGDGKTEQMLKSFGAKLTAGYDRTTLSSETVDFRRRRKTAPQDSNYRVTIQGNVDLVPAELELPKDALLSALFASLAALIRKSQVELDDIDIQGNGFQVLQLLKDMGAQISIKKMRKGDKLSVAQVIASSSEVRGRKVSLLQSEEALPLLSVIACFSEGASIIRGFSGLRHGKIDKLKVISDSLRKMGAKIGELEDGLVIEGRKTLDGADLDGKNDFSISLGLLLASLLAEDRSRLTNCERILDFYPNLFELLDSVCEYYK